MGAVGQLGVLSATKPEQAKLCKTGLVPKFPSIASSCTGLVPETLYPEVASCNL